MQTLRKYKAPVSPPCRNPHRYKLRRVEIPEPPELSESPFALNIAQPPGPSPPDPFSATFRCMVVMFAKKNHTTWLWIWEFFFVQ